MLLLKLVYTEDYDFVKELYELKNLLKGKNITIGLIESEVGKNHIVKVISDEVEDSQKTRGIIILYISNILYQVVIEEYKKKEMFDFLIENYFFLKQKEIIEVEEEIMKVLNCKEALKNENSIYCMNRMNSVIEKINECLEENDEINISGFLRFRMKELRTDIEKIIDKVVEEYMIEKEYKEFVKLLKYFVDIQESKIDEINIYIKDDGSYKIKNGDGEDIFQEFLKELIECKAEKEANIEDIIISGLITNAPKKVIIHNKEHCVNPEFIETISNVFGDRMEFCSACSECLKGSLNVENYVDNVKV